MVSSPPKTLIIALLSFFCWALGLSLHADLSSLVFCPGTYTYLHLSRLSALSPQCRRSAGFPGVFFPCTQPVISLKAVKCGNNRAYLIDFPSLRNHYTLLPDFHCLENILIFLKYYLFFGYLGLEGKPGPSFLILAKGRSHLFVCFCLFQSME